MLNFTQKTDIGTSLRRQWKPFNVNVNAFSRGFEGGLNFGSKFGRHLFSVNSFISKVFFFLARVKFLFLR